MTDEVIERMKVLEYKVESFELLINMVTKNFAPELKEGIDNIISNHIDSVGVSKVPHHHLYEEMLVALKELNSSFSASLDYSL